MVPNRQSPQRPRATVIARPRHFRPGRVGPLLLAMSIAVAVQACASNSGQGGATGGAGNKGGDTGTGTGGGSGGGVGGRGGLGTGGVGGGANHAFGSGGTASGGAGGRAGGGAAAGSGGGSGGAGGALPPSCSVTLESMAPPVVLSSRIGCDNGLGYSLAAATSTTADFTAWIAPSGRPSSLMEITVTSAGGTSAPVPTSVFGLVATSDRDHHSVNVVRQDARIAWLTQPAAAGQPIGDSPVLSGLTTDDGVNPADAATGPDGSRHVLVVRYNGGLRGLELETAPSSTAPFASASVVARSMASSVLNVDGSGAAHVFYWQPDQGIMHWQPGGAAATIAFAIVSASTVPRLSHVRPAGTSPAIGVAGLTDALHVLRPRADGSFENIALASSGQTPYMLPFPTMCTSSSCANVPTHQQGEFARALALATDKSGALWIATVRDHLDRDLTIRAAGEACMCMSSLATDRSTSSLVVQRLSPGTSAPSDALWTYDLGPGSSQSFGSILLDATIDAGYLHLLVGASNNVGARTFVLDLATLP